MGYTQLANCIFINVFAMLGLYNVEVNTHMHMHAHTHMHTHTQIHT